MSCWSRNRFAPSAAAPWYGLEKSFVRSELVIVPAQVYVVDYYAASYKCAHCETQTGESYIRRPKLLFQ